MNRWIFALAILVWSTPVAAQPADGDEGGACYGNGTCNAGLVCDGQVCARVPDGDEGGACYGNGTCNAGLTCDAATRQCVAGAAVAPAPAPAPVDSAGSCYGCAGSLSATAQVGVLFPGSAYVEVVDASVDTDAGFMLHVAGDYQVASRFSVGAFALYAAAGAEGESLGVTTIGATVKGAFLFDRFVLRPGLALAYQLISGDSLSEDSVVGFDLGAMVEVIYPLNEKLGVAGQLSFISQPAGGNDLTDVTFAPIFFLTGGVGYLF